MTDRFARFHAPEERRVLTNGLKVIAVRRDHLPIFSATVLLPSGTAMEAIGEAGLSSMTASLLTRGTRTRDVLQIAEAADGIAAGLGVSSDYDYTLAGVSSLSRDAAEAMALLAEVLTTPSFPADEMERRRGELLGILQRRQDDPGDLVRNRFLERIYGGHPYRHPREGTPETIARFSRDDLARFYRRHYRPDGAILAVVGDLERERVVELAEDLLGGWENPGGRAGIEPVPPRAEPSSDRLQKDGLTQAVVRIGCQAICRNSPSYLAAVVMNYALGGSGAGSRLHQTLREDRGLTYEVFSNVQPRLEAGYFFASCRTAIETTDEALELMRQELGRFRREGPTAAEVELARRFFTGSLPLSLETNDHLATNALAREFYGLEEEFWLRDIERLDTLTVAEVHEAAREIIDVDRMAVVVAGDFRQPA